MRFHRSATVALLALAVMLVLYPGDGGKPAYAATFTVDSTIDEGDSSPGDGTCSAVTTGDCTLRAAIMETNALPGADTITLPAGAYILTIVGTGEDASATGDLDITDDHTITGAGEAVTSIDGGGLDRVLDVLSAATNATVSASTIRNGMVSPDADGGGIRNGGILALAGVTVSDSTARAGGGIYNGLNNTLTLDDTTVTSNTATTTLGESGEAAASPTGAP